MANKTIKMTRLWRHNMRILLLVALLVPSLAKAELVQNLFIDTKAMSLGNAVTADPTGIMDIHFNPAGLTKLEGRQVQVQLQGVMLRSEASFALPDGYDDTESGLLPIHEDPVLNEGNANTGKGTPTKPYPGI